MLIAVAGCAGRTSDVPLAAAAIELSDVPFYSQTTDQCGPAALTSVLQASGVDVQLDAIRKRVYLPERGGSLQIEILGASRAHDRLPVRIPSNLDAIIELLQSGQPVLVMQNLGIPLIPLWHYAVVVGYLPESDEFVLRSGIESRQLRSRARFLATWKRADHWAIALFGTRDPVAGVELTAYLDEAAIFESHGRIDIAQPAYERAVERWPESSLAHLGLGNSLYARGDLQGAADAYDRALRLEPSGLAARNNLAHTLAVLGCVDRALSVLAEIPRSMDSHPLRNQLQSTRAEIEDLATAKEQHCRWVDEPVEEPDVR